MDPPIFTPNAFQIDFYYISHIYFDDILLFLFNAIYYIKYIEYCWNIVFSPTAGVYLCSYILYFRCNILI